MTTTTLDRPPRSWDRRELDLLQVRIKDYTDRNAAVFFELDELPARTAAPPLLLDHDSVSAKQMDTLGMYEQNFFIRLKVARRSTAGHARGYVDLAENVLRMLQFHRGDRVVYRDRPMPLSVGTQKRAPKADLCFMTSGTVEVPLLLVQKEVGKGNGPRDKATAHFVGQALAAFRYANDQRRAAFEELASATFVGISMMKTAPVFHKIRVTRQLLDAVQDPGAAVETATTVERFTPNSTSASPPRGLEDKAECRRYLFRCFEACRLLVKRVAPPAPDCSDDEDFGMHDL
ncbi:hypothetical protein K466DRAFT_667104 [Polyporus arcularius HHB13444]|uniref:Fungal-type protein kinase domain-containing protein n=1 Tax=Polyporus arcularius HHB13444 TaxID=1314778 RepID=A0A5C3P6P0_9APHY|nr:hypothetical protein K466DRAFT_667104 [Polyporus arcularius HHB13444]